MKRFRLIPANDRRIASAEECQVVRDPDELQMVAQDAASMRGGGAVALVRPRNAWQLARWLREHPRESVMAQGALTSLTGGATPDRDVVVAMSALRSVELQGDVARVGAGVVLGDLRELLRQEGLFYPPGPTHDGATLGGNVATNAAGAATFKYGTTRDWVRWVRIVLRSGDVLELHRGQLVVAPGERVVLEGSQQWELTVPTYLTPSLKKVSMGYFVSDPLDMVDLFVGSEGTLGIVTDIELGLVPAPAVVTGLVFTSSEQQAIRLAGELRDRSGPDLDIRSIELFDVAAIELLEKTEALRKYNVSLPSGARACLLFEQEVPAGAGDEQLLEQIASGERGAGQGPMAALLEVLERHGVVETTELAMPGDRRRKDQLAAVREAVPLAISETLQEHHRRDPRVHKVGGDMIVPFEHFEEMFGRYREAFARRGLSVVIFGHISDGNVHPNALPATATEMEAAEDALLELARQVRSVGGAPLSEHGVGKNMVKQRMLREYWGPGPIEQMKAVKQALDPGWTLGRGVLWPKPS